MMINQYIREHDMQAEMLTRMSKLVYKVCTVGNL